MQLAEFACVCDLDECNVWQHFVDAIVPEVQKYQLARTNSVKTLGELLVIFVEQAEVYEVCITCLSTFITTCLTCISITDVKSNKSKCQIHPNKGVSSQEDCWSSNNLKGVFAGA